MFNITNKDKIAIKLGTQKNLQGSLFQNLISTKFKNSMEDRDYKKEKQLFEETLSDSYAL